MELTEKRAADRIKMAAILQDLIIDCGATYARRDGVAGGYPGPRVIRLEVRAPRGLCVAVDLDGESCQPDVHVLSWHMSSDTDARLSDSFGGNVNRCHFRKATYIAHGFEDLCDQLREGLEKAASGRAFDAQREADCIAKDGTAAERAARWNKWREEEAAKQSVKA